uniref:Ubiquitin carboxyl-terminal hydrolase n=2 Tax=Cacopsylla melanoneura TaxID=428564 RepID=A0A8D8M4W1_9HEMI
MDSNSDTEEDVMYHRHRTSGLKGLKNLGNTCYMNAALQALSNIKPFKDFFLKCSIDAIKLDCRNNPKSSSKCPQLALAFQRFLKEMWLDKPEQCLTPADLFDYVKHTNHLFDDYMQHDSQEFLKCFIDLLHEELKVASRDNETDSIDDEDATDGEYETCDSAVSENSSLSDDNSQLLVAHSTTDHNYLNGKCVQNGNCVKSDLFNTPNRSHATIPNDLETIEIACHNVAVTPPSEVFLKMRTPEPAPPPPTPKEVKYKSIISQVFDGKISSSVRCLSCNKVSTRIENFQDLSLPLPTQDIVAQRMSNMHIQTPYMGLNLLANVFLYQFELLSYICNFLKQWLKGPVITLSDCLNAFFQDVHFRDNNKYSCENCNGLRDGVQTIKIKELPEVLCIHLKRFRHDMMFSKIQGHVSFPLGRLDLTPYLHPNCKSKVCTYDLVSVICHHGSTSGGGHYTTFSFNSARNEWYEFNDRDVTRVPVEKVMSCEAYVLFYVKDDSHIVPVRKFAQHLMMDGRAEDFYALSIQWATRFLSFGEPGPIDNSDFLCEHGNLLPEKEEKIKDLMQFVPDTMWQYLYSRFGGGPVHRGEISLCEICTQRLLDLLAPRALEEYYRVFGEVYTNVTPVRDPFELFHMSCRDNYTHIVFYVNRDWFQTWYSFALNQSYIIPGPINNSMLHTDNFLEHNFPLTYNQWQYLVSLYGGGPELCITPSRMDLVREWLGSNDFLSVADTDEDLTPSCAGTVDEDCDLNGENASKIADCMDFE